MCVLAHPPAVMLEGPRGSGARVSLPSPLPLTPRYVRGAAGSERTVERSLTDAKAFPHNARLQLAAMRSLLAAGLRDTAALAPVDPPPPRPRPRQPAIACTPAARRRSPAAAQDLAPGGRAIVAAAIENFPANSEVQVRRTPPAAAGAGGRGGRD